MENIKDFDYIKAQLDTLPQITLPYSLTAESLWARVDAGELVMADADLSQQGTHSEQTAIMGEVLQWVGRMRPVLSYAAVFVVLVAVYYGAGLDSAATVPAPEAAPQMMMASPPMQYNGENAPEPHSKSRMADDSIRSDGMAADPPMPAPPPPIPAADPPMPAPPPPIPAAAPPMAAPAPMMESAPTTDGSANNSAMNGMAVSPSTQDIKDFAELLEGIALNEGEILKVYISDIDNTIAVTIAKLGEDRLRDEITAKMLLNNIPDTSVTILTIDT